MAEPYMTSSMRTAQVPSSPSVSFWVRNWRKPLSVLLGKASELTAPKWILLLRTSKKAVKFYMRLGSVSLTRPRMNWVLLSLLPGTILLIPRRPSTWVILKFFCSVITPNRRFYAHFRLPPPLLSDTHIVSFVEYPLITLICLIYIQDNK